MWTSVVAITNRNIRTVCAVLRRTLKNWPDPSVTLVGKKWRDPFLVLIACLLSLRTKDATTLQAAQRLFARARTPQEMLALSLDELQRLIHPVGFYRTKAKRIHEICRVLLEKYDGRVPASMDELLSLPGVGRKTANLVLTEGFGIPAMCVDTHVHRISNRWGYVKTRTPEETERALRKKLPKRYWGDYNALLVLWGQNICHPVSPKCSLCPLSKICPKIGVKRHR